MLALLLSFALADTYENYLASVPPPVAPQQVERICFPDLEEETETMLVVHGAATPVFGAPVTLGDALLQVPGAQQTRRGLRMGGGAPMVTIDGINITIPDLPRMPRQVSNGI